MVTTAVCQALRGKPRPSLPKTARADKSRVIGPEQALKQTQPEGL